MKSLIAIYKFTARVPLKLHTAPLRVVSSPISVVLYVCPVPSLSGLQLFLFGRQLRSELLQLSPKVAVLLLEVTELRLHFPLGLLQILPTLLLLLQTHCEESTVTLLVKASFCTFSVLCVVRSLTLEL